MGGTEGDRTLGAAGPDEVGPRDSQYKELLCQPFCIISHHASMAQPSVPPPQSRIQTMGTTPPPTHSMPSRSILFSISVDFLSKIKPGH